MLAPRGRNKYRKKSLTNTKVVDRWARPTPHGDGPPRPHHAPIRATVAAPPLCGPTPLAPFVRPAAGPQPRPLASGPAARPPGTTRGRGARFFPPEWVHRTPARARHGGVAASNPPLTSVQRVGTVQLVAKFSCVAWDVSALAHISAVDPQETQQHASKEGFTLWLEPPHFLCTYMQLGNLLIKVL